MSHDYQSFLYNRNWMTLNVVKVDLVQQDVTKVDSGRVYIVQFSLITAEPYPG